MDATSFINDPIQAYLQAVNAVPPLTKEEEAELSQHILDNDRQAESARQRLVEANLAMVVAIAQHNLPEGMYLLDLVIKGNDGLLLALKRLADAPATNFSVHAAVCVNAAIAEAVAEPRG